MDAGGGWALDGGGRHFTDLMRYILGMESRRGLRHQQGLRNLSDTTIQQKEKAVMRLMSRMR